MNIYETYILVLDEEPCKMEVLKWNKWITKVVIIIITIIIIIIILPNIKQSKCNQAISLVGQKIWSEN